MTSRFKDGMIASLLIGLLQGCSEPGDVGPVAPPGYELKPPAPAETSEAIGETGKTAKAPAKSVARPNDPISPSTPIGQPRTTDSGLVYETLREGTGEIAMQGVTVTVNYKGTLTDGTVFDSSYDRNSPFDVVDIGQGRVIRGWNEGIPGMKVGEKRKLTIPPNLGYAQVGSPPKIPGNATLIFEVELLGIK